MTRILTLVVKGIGYQLFIRTVGHLPLPVVRFIGRGLGLWLWITDSRMARVTRENINRCFPELGQTETRRLSKQSLLNTGMTIAETTVAWTRSVKNCQALIHTVSGEESIHRDTGVIFVIPHLGNWEIINHYLGQHYGLTHMYQPNASKRLETTIQNARERTGTRFVQVGQQGIRAQIRALKEKSAIGTMPDQEPDVHTGEFADFFGIPALTNQVVSGLQERTHAQVIIARCLRDADGFEIRFTPCSDATTAGINLAIESAVREAPEQYLWSYKRFRTRPNGEPDYYAVQDPPLKRMMQYSGLRTLLHVSRAIPASVKPLLVSTVTKISPVLLKKRTRASQRNLALCNKPANWHKPAMTTLIDTGLSLGTHWYGNKTSRLINAVYGLEALSDGPTIVLTPPLGYRELVMRFLGENYTTVEYYHPNENGAVDDLIRDRRTAWGIKLVPHTQKGREHIGQLLKAGGVATLCPDQQPRLRGGKFVPFFGEPALTTLAIPELVVQNNAKLVFGFAVKPKSGSAKTGIEIHFVPFSPANGVPVDRASGDRVPEPEMRQSEEDEILSSVNRQLETLIETYPEAYRWSDKRFNIRPAGLAKVYR